MLHEKFLEDEDNILDRTLHQIDEMNAKSIIIASKVRSNSPSLKKVLQINSLKIFRNLRLQFIVFQDVPMNTCKVGMAKNYVSPQKPRNY